jgi:predicted nuclease with TOPRIM domain
VQVNKLRKQLDLAERTAADSEGAIQKLSAEHAHAVRRLEEEVRVQQQAAAAVRDELDLSRDKVRQWATMEQTLARYKQKLDEAGDLRKRVKEAEDARDEQMEKMLSLEAEVAKLNTQKVQSYALTRGYYFFCFLCHVEKLPVLLLRSFPYSC